MTRRICEHRDEALGFYIRAAEHLVSLRHFMDEARITSDTSRLVTDEAIMPR